MLVLVAAFMPAIANTRISTLGFGVLASVLFLYGGTRLLPVSGAGLAVLLADLETVWSRHPHPLQIAAAACGLLLLAAYELKSWADVVAATPSDRDAYRAQARALAERFGAVTLLVAALVLAARGFAHGPALGIAGAAAAIVTAGGLLVLAKRVR